MMFSIKTNTFSVLMNTNSYNRVTEEDQPQLEVEIHLQNLWTLQALSFCDTIVVSGFSLQNAYPRHTHEFSVTVTQEFPSCI